MISIKTFESYNEGEDSIFEHLGKKYSVDKLISVSQTKPVTPFSVDKLKWILGHTDVEDQRIINSDLNYPIIITELSGKWYVLDGAHRLSKAVEQKLKSINVKIVSTSELKTCAI